MSPSAPWRMLAVWNPCWVWVGNCSLEICGIFRKRSIASLALFTKRRWRSGAEWGGGFRDRRSYFVDSRLVMAVTDQQRTAFITCYHLHKTFSRACPGASQDEQETSRRLLAEKQRLLDLPSDKIRNLRFLKS